MEVTSIPGLVFIAYIQPLKVPHVEINGIKYKTDPQTTNVTDSIIKLTDRSLHLKESHPVGILRDLIEKKLNSVDNTFKIFNNFKPVVTTMETSIL
ncbi:CGH_1_collapsed_G0015490.mRNA.1.CDS.1 [Saccharomyces cerevisiae]|nr:CGH_1_collapsed_G0015490.mRNA.1.CDS.1 [Saccharomyces cerevisiae]